jgi:hypothetical protein
MKIIAAYAIFTGTVMSLLPQTGAAGSLQSLDSAKETLNKSTPMQAQAL